MRESTPHYALSATNLPSDRTSCGPDRPALPETADFRRAPGGAADHRLAPPAVAGQPVAMGAVWVAATGGVAAAAARDAEPVWRRRVLVAVRGDYSAAGGCRRCRCRCCCGGAMVPRPAGRAHGV